MIVNSLAFMIVSPIIFVVYWVIPSQFNKYRNVFLLTVSYLLYMNWKPSFALILLGVTLITWIGGAILDKQYARTKKTLCWCFAVLGLLPLLVFKYYNFLNDSLTSVLESAGLHFSLPGLNWAIPVGISFFTFQAVGYLLDVYHKRVPAEKSFVDYALFVSFFPQVTSGPISTAKDLMPQIKNIHVFKYEQGRTGLRLLLWGLFMKSVIADRAGIYVDTVYANLEAYTGLNCFLASVLYTIQIYCDFAGYSLMAIGIAKTLGFNLINNFERPYLAASVTEFWKRWHISLTRWLTTHVYINLGGNRCSKLRQYLNIMITFLVSGLWHGANWTFVIWGALHGLFQIVEKAIMGDKLKAEMKQVRHNLTVLRVLRIVITFNLVNVAWIFFRMPTINQAMDVICKIFTLDHTGSLFNMEGLVMEAYLVIGMIPLFIFEIMQEYKNDFLERIAQKAVLKWSVYIIIASMIVMFGVHDSSQFIYVSF